MISESFTRGLPRGNSIKTLAGNRNQSILRKPFEKRLKFFT